jgi:hypothetical protein
MVCIRCKMVVKDELTKLGLNYTSAELGEADITDEITTNCVKKSGQLYYDQDWS